MSDTARLPIRFDLGGGYAAGVISGGIFSRRRHHSMRSSTPAID
jgi:hypothetical protein